MKVLVVDDSTFMRQILKATLLSLQVDTVLEADNGLHAISVYKEYNPDLVFMDITMPCMSGLHALQVISAYDRHAKVIMCSAMGQQAYVMKALELGASDFITKPFSEGKIKEVFKRIYDDYNSKLCSNKI